MYNLNDFKFPTPIASNPVIESGLLINFHSKFTEVFGTVVVFQLMDFESSPEQMVSFVSVLETFATGFTL